MDVQSLANMLSPFYRNQIPPVPPSALSVLYSQQMANSFIPDNMQLLSSRFDQRGDQSGSAVKRENSAMVTLEEKELWQQFDRFGTEMIVTRTGRRMFPILKVRVQNMETERKYMVALRLIPADEARYKFCNGQWQISGRAEPHYGAGLFFHPDGVNTGKHWMEERTVSFHRVKLTNNSKENSPTNILLNSMHKYQPTIILVEVNELGAQWSTAQSFPLADTKFYAVTAYQNEHITQLKIDNNPFAKGFRDREKVFPQKRCTPFLEQLKAAATSDVKSTRTSCIGQHSTEELLSPEKSETVPTINDSFSSPNAPMNMFYANAKMGLFHQQQQYHLHQQNPTNFTTNPLMGLSMDNLPNISLPFSLLPSRSSRT